MRSVRNVFGGLLLLLVFAAVSWAGGSPLEVTFFAVGKADAVLIRQGGAVMLIDTATSEDAPYVVSRLREKGVERIDSLVITHMDKDHVGGAALVLASFPVGAVYQSNHRKESRYYQSYTAAAAACGIHPTVVREDMKVSLASLDITMHAPEEGAGMVPNDYSLMTSLIYGNVRLLFTGDATPRRLLTFLSGKPSHYDFLKVPHHGMLNTKSRPFMKLLREITPQYAVITDSRRDDLRAKVSLLLEIYGVRRVLMTDNGDVELTTDGDSLELHSRGL